jgi:curved DNA-binding protein CbpA
MPQRNPFAVLGLPVDATAEAIKTAWRRLARQHHPDVASGDKTVQQGATRTMAEINAAYQELQDPEKRRLHRDAATRGPRNGRESEGPFDGHARPYHDPARPSWGARPRPSRPVTARIDTSSLLRPRNSTLRPLGRSQLPGLPPRPRALVGREPPRASDPTGPMRRRRGPAMDSELPTLAEALDTRLRFGKFQGLTLADVAGIEPTYVDWIVRTIARDPEVALAARVVLRYLERSGVLRRPRLDTVFPRG